MSKLRNRARAALHAQFFPGFWLFIRLVLGVEWIRGSWEKIGDSGWTDAPRGAAVSGFLQGAIQKASASGGHPEVQQWFADATNRFFLPHTQPIAMLVSYGELLVGIALIIGFLTRFTAIFGLLMNLMFLFAGTTSTNPQMLLLEAAMILVGLDAGVLGIDGLVLPWLRTRLGVRIRHVRVIAVAVGVASAAWLALIASDTTRWLIIFLIAAVIAVAVGSIRPRTGRARQ